MGPAVLVTSAPSAAHTRRRARILAPRGSLTPRPPVTLPGFPRRPGSRSVRGGKRRPGRIVPLRTRPRRRHNRAIMRKSSSASDGPTRTILPERHNREPGGAADRPARHATRLRRPHRPEPPGRVGRMRRMGLVRATICPNLLQRRSAAGSAARRSAEYQRFSSGAPARWGPLQQIWTSAGTGLAGRTSVGRRPPGNAALTGVRPRAASEGASRAPRGPVMWCPRRTIMSRFDNNDRRRSGRRDESLVTEPGVNRAIPGRVTE